MSDDLVNPDLGILIGLRKSNINELIMSSFKTETGFFEFKF